MQSSIFRPGWRVALFGIIYNLTPGPTSYLFLPRFVIHLMLGKSNIQTWDGNHIHIWGILTEELTELLPVGAIGPFSGHHSGTRNLWLRWRDASGVGPSKLWCDQDHDEGYTCMIFTLYYVCLHVMWYKEICWVWEAGLWFLMNSYSKFLFYVKALEAVKEIDHFLILQTCLRVHIWDLWLLGPRHPKRTRA